MNRRDRDVRSFAADLTRVRLDAGLSIRQLSVRTGIPTGTLGGYFAGRHAPPSNRPEVLESILAECGVTPPGRLDWHARVQDIHMRVTAVRESPYRGLGTYGIEDQDLYFGREDEQRRLLDVVAVAAAGELPVVCIVGTSASGKSSLVRAGLLAHLLDRSPAWVPTVTDLATDAPLALPTATEAPQVLVLDQVEGLLVTDDGTPSHRSVVSWLEPALDWAQETVGAPRLLVLVLRADLYPYVSQDPRLRRALQEHQVVLSDLDRAALQRIIEGPARESGLELEDGLVDLILTGAGTDGGQSLPHLSYLLARMWEAGDRRVLTVADYRKLGGFEGAIQVAAEAAFAELDLAEQERAKLLLLRMITLHPDVGPVRRLLRTERADDLAVLSHFVARYLVVIGESGAQLSHEALLRSWPRLRGWIEQDRVRLTATGALSRASRDWEEGGRDPELLLRGGRLEAALAYVNPDHLSAAETAFLTRSQVEADARRRKESRRLRRSRQAVATLAAMGLISVVLAGNTMVARSDAEDARQAAESRQVAYYATGLRGTDAPVADLLAVSAVRRDDNRTTRSILAAATAGSILARYDFALAPRSVAAWSEGTATAVLGATGEVVVAVEEDGLTEVARIPSPHELPASVFGLSASRDGEVLAVADGSNQLRLFDARNPVAPVATESFALTEPANDVEVTPDGRVVVASLGGSGVRVWTRLEGPWKSAQVDSPAGTTTNVSVASYGSLLAAVSTEGELMVGAVAEDGVRVLDTQAVSDLALFAVDISPDHDRVAVAGADRSVRVYRIGEEKLELEIELEQFSTWVNDVRFSRDGKLLLAGSSNREVKAWPVSDGVMSTHPAHTLTLPNEVLRIREGADQEWIFIDNGDQTYRWDVVGSRLPDHEGIVFISRFARDAPILITQAGRGDARTRVWDVADSTRPLPLADLRSPEGVGVPSGASDVSPDGRWVVVGTTDGHALVWDIASPERPLLALITEVAVDSLVGGVSISEDGSWAVAMAGASMRVIELGPDSARAGDQVEFDGATIAIDAGRSHVARTLEGGGVDILRRGEWEEAVSTWETGGPSLEARFGPEDGELFVAGTDQKVHIVDTSNPDEPRLRHTLTGPRSSINATDVSVDGERIAAAVIDGTAWVWRRRGDTWESELEIPMPTPQILSVGWSPAEPVLAAGGHDGVVALVRVDAQDAMSRVCSSRGDTLTEEEWAVALSDVPFTPPCPETDE